MEYREIVLRPLRTHDAERMLEWLNNDDITAFLPLSSHVATIKSALDFIHKAQDDTKMLHRAIVDEKDIYYGTVSLKNIDHESHRAEYAISMHPDGIGNGMSKVASDRILEIAFEQINLKTVYLNVLKINRRAVRFYEKMGWKYVSSSTLDYRGQNEVLLWYEISDEDWHSHVGC